MENGEGSTMRNFRICALHKVAKVIISRRLQHFGHVARMGGGWSTLKMLTGKRTLVRPRGRWEGNIRMDLKEIIRFGIRIVGEPL